MKDEFHAKLGIFSVTLPPDQISAFLGMKCDKGYHIGDRRGGTTIYEKENAWLVYSRIPRYAPLQDHVSDILERVSPVVEKIGGMAKQADVEVEFGCIVHTSDRPAMFFTKEQITAICKMGASLDIDLYVFPTES